MKRIATAIAVAAFANQCAIAEQSPASPSAAAQQALPMFLAAVKDRPSWAFRFRVLVEVGSDEAKERFWLNDFRVDGNGYSGQISSMPRFAEGVRLGQRVPVTPMQVLDWTYEHPTTRKISGHFHLCAEWAGLPAEQAREQREYWGVLCDGQQ